MQRFSQPQHHHSSTQPSLPIEFSILSQYGATARTAGTGKEGKFSDREDLKQYFKQKSAVDAILSRDYDLDDELGNNHAPRNPFKDLSRNI